MNFRKVNFPGIKQAFLILVLALFTGLAFYGYQASSAQTTNTPAPKPTATPKAAPSLSATPIDDDEPIRIDTELVNLSVRVVDRNNKSIGILSQSDFTVYEDNVAQPIEFFSKEEVPVNYALVVDNSFSLRSQLEKVIEASKILVNSNRPGDETCYIRFVNSEKISIEHDFSDNKTSLIEKLDEMFVEGGSTAVNDAVFLAVEKVDEYEKSKSPNDRKRRAVIVVTDGEDKNSFYNESQLFEMLREADVQIYTVGFVGELDKEAGFIRKSTQSKAMSLLNRLAQETGGKAYFPTSVSELPQIARDIAGELRTQYSIGYAPTNDRKDGTYRTIRVAISDGPKKEKRIGLTRGGRTAVLDQKSVPVLQKPAPSPAKP
jgi:Ca-activated chloride channel family protein